MHEIRRYEKMITQEYLNGAKLESSKIREDSWMEQAVKISKKYDLLGRIGIEKEEYSCMFNLYLAIRLLKTKIYDECLELSEKTRNRDKLEQFAGWFKDRFCTSIEDRKTVRTIELAANALITGGASFNESKLKTEIVFDPRFLSDWGTRWSNEIGQRNISGDY